MPTLVKLAVEKERSPYIGDGSNPWPAVHVLDAARVRAGAREGQRHPSRGWRAGHRDEDDRRDDWRERRRARRLADVPDEIKEHFGWLGAFFSRGMIASSAKTQQQLGWQPTHGGLLATCSLAAITSLRINLRLQIQSQSIIIIMIIIIIIMVMRIRSEAQNEFQNRNQTWHLLLDRSDVVRCWELVFFLDMSLARRSRHHDVAAALVAASSSRKAARRQSTN